MAAPRNKTMFGCRSLLTTATSRWNSFRRSSPKVPRCGDASTTFAATRVPRHHALYVFPDRPLPTVVSNLISEMSSFHSGLISFLSTMSSTPNFSARFSCSVDSSVDELTDSRLFMSSASSSMLERVRFSSILVLSSFCRSSVMNCPLTTNLYRKRFVGIAETPFNCGIITCRG